MEEMGASAVKFSLILKIFLKYFGSLRLISKQIPKMWREHYTIGDLEMSEFSEKKRYAVLKLRDFKVHPIYCILLKGYFLQVGGMILKTPVITCQETKCPFKGDEYHEYLFKW